MSFKSKTDCFGLADDTTIVCTAEEDGKSIQEVTAQGQDGSIVANETFGESDAPTREYELKADVTWAAGTKKCGKVNTYLTNGKAALLKVEITTGAGASPTLKASGEQVQNGATDVSTYSIPATSISTECKAQILWGAFSLTGTGCHLTSANYTAECSIVKATKEGACLSFDVAQGKLTATISIKQCGDVTPTLTALDGFKVTSALACSNPDADYPTYSATLTKYLAKDVVTVSE